eukprot:CFRG4626T1
MASSKLPSECIPIATTSYSGQAFSSTPGMSQKTAIGSAGCRISSIRKDMLLKSTPRVVQKTANGNKSGTKRQRSALASSARPSSSEVFIGVCGRRKRTGLRVGTSFDWHLQLFQFSENQTLVKTITTVQMFNPMEIIMPNTACMNGKTSHMYRVLSENFPDVSIMTVSRSYFNESKGLEIIRRLCQADVLSSVEIEISSKYYCLATAAALLKYVEHIHDIHSVRYLELIANKRDAKTTGSLLSALDRTSTPGGARLLRMNILQPSTDIATIRIRQESVQELLENEEMFEMLQSVLDRFLDLDHLLITLVKPVTSESLKAADHNITSIIRLKHILDLIPSMVSALDMSDSTLLKAYAESLKDERFASLQAHIVSVIDHDTIYQKNAVRMQAQKLFAVKESINGLLDVARGTYTETIEAIHNLITQYADDFKIDCQPSYSISKGFRIIVTTSGNEEDLPEIFVQRQAKKKNQIHCTTRDLIRYNDRVTESLEEVYLMSGIVIGKVLHCIQDNIGALFKLTDCVAMVDMLLSFAKTVLRSDKPFVRPEFTDTLVIKDGRHPIIDGLKLHENLISNDAYVSSASNIIIVTGQNMSGKSTYLQQMALLQVMAQIGIHVPAQYASFSVCDHLFARAGADDDLETCSSTFMLEAKQIANILLNAKHSSFVLIDELGRGTTDLEGSALCYAVCEYFANSGTFCFVATHYPDVASLGDIYPSIMTLAFSSTKKNCPLNKNASQLSHKLSRRTTGDVGADIQSILALAKFAGFPETVVKLTEEIAKNHESTPRAKPIVNVNQTAKQLLARQLLQVVSNSTISTSGVATYIFSLKDLYDQCMLERTQNEDD